MEEGREGGLREEGLREGEGEGEAEKEKKSEKFDLTIKEHTHA